MALSSTSSKSESSVTLADEDMETNLVSHNLSKNKDDSFVVNQGDKKRWKPNGKINNKIYSGDKESNFKDSAINEDDGTMETTSNVQGD